MNVQDVRPVVDGVVVASGYAVWAEHIPNWVGIVTILYLGTMILLNIPRIMKAWKDFFKKEK